MEPYHNTAIVLGDLKEALLYFEYVIPLNVAGYCMGMRPQGSTGVVKATKAEENYMQGYRELSELFTEKNHISRLYPPALADNNRFKIVANMFDGFLFSYMIKSMHGEEKFKEYVVNLADVVKASGPVNPDWLCPSIVGLNQMFSQITKDFSLQDIPVDCSRFFVDEATSDGLKESLLINKIRVIDTDKIKLPDILEFRKDKTNMDKMRSFRLFAYKQYSGKERPFIEDDIQKQMADYNDAVNASGFETTIKSLSFLFESKFLIGALATSAVGLLFQNIELAKEAFATGAIVEVGKLSLQYAKQRHELRRICKDNPISYLVDAKKELE